MTNYLGVWEPDRIEDVAQLRDLGRAYGFRVVAFGWNDFGLRGASWSPPELDLYEDWLRGHEVTLVLGTHDNSATPLAEFQHPTGPSLYMVGSVRSGLPFELSASDRGENLLRIEITSEDFFPIYPTIAAGIVLHDRAVKEARRATSPTT